MAQGRRSADEAGQTRIDAADAGLSDEELARYWRDGDTPEALVAWFAEKHDLIRFEPNPFRPAAAA